MREIQYDVDIAKQNYEYKACMQNDDLKITLNVYNNASKYDLVGTIVKLNFAKPDGTPVTKADNITVENNTISCILNEEYTNIHGKAKFEFEINKDGKTTTFPLELIIAEKVFQSSVVNNKIVELLDLVKIDEAIDDFMDSIKQKQAELSSQIDENANLLNARMDTFTKLEEGSTTGDAELIDGRVGNDSITYASIGEAIRNQTRNVMCNNSVTKTFAIDDTTENTIIELPLGLYKGQEVEICIEADNSVLLSTASIPIGIQKSDGSYVNDVLKPALNTWSTLALTTEVKTIRAWIDESIILSNGEIKFMIRHKNNIFTQLNILKGKVDDINKLKTKTITGQIIIDDNSKKTYGTEIEILKNKEICIRIEDNEGVFNSDEVLVVGYDDIDGNRHSDVVKTKINTECICKFENDCKKILFWANDKLKTGVVNCIVNYTSTLYEDIEGIENINNKIKNINKNIFFSIIGDSISTYRHWIKDSYAWWFSDEGNKDTNNVSSVKDTWWWQIMNESKMKLVTNCSYSGSTICNTGYDGADVSTTSFVGRMKDICENAVIRPDLIFTEGGTNDRWAGSPVGELKYSDWTEDDLKCILPSFCYMLDHIKLFNPQARIINIMNVDITASVKESMKVACEHYEVENVELENITKENGHPNKEGMTQIKEQVLEILNNEVIE